MTLLAPILLQRAADFFGDDVTWVLPDAAAELRKIETFRAVHPFRPDFLALKNMGVAVTPQWPDAVSSTIALNLPRQAEWACGLLAEALQKLPAGSNLLMIAPNDLGGKRYAKLLGEHFELAFAESKHHCRLVALRRPAALPDVVKEWKNAFQPQKVEGTEMMSLPGTFSHGRVDAGSALLTKHLPPLSGAVADFGAGWGYLARHLLSQATPPLRIDLYEADDNALRMAQQNLAAAQNVKFFWHDITSEGTAQNYDAVVMNPPFHDLRDASPDIGKRFIAAAAAALKPGGKLWMVANTHLPYEEALTESFAQMQPVVRENGFKVLAATR